MSASDPPPKSSVPTSEPARSKREMARTGALVLLAVLITLFAVFNLDEVKVNWVIGSSKAPLIVVIVISLLVGILLTYFADRVAGKHRKN